MLEYFDDTLGPVKLVNVTEARANFAKILSEENTYFVITKNTKPKRVVIGYQEFCDLKRLAVKHPLESEEAKNVPIDLPMTETEKPATPKPAKTTSRVEGLLSQHFSTSLERAPVVEEPKAVSLSDEILKPSFEEDYFILSEDLPPEEELKNEAEPHPLSSEESLLEKLTQNLSLSDEDEILPEDKIEEAKSDEDLPLNIDLSSKNESSQPMTPEEEAYFNKYRKLYESVPAKPLTQTFERRVYFDPSHNDVKHEEPKPETFVSSDQMIEHFNLSLSDETPIDDGALKSDTLEWNVSPPDKTPVLSEESGEENSDLPSLQELLRSLNISDDANETQTPDLKQSEIDRIIKEIRHEE